MKAALLLLAASLWAPDAVWAQDARQIVRRSVERDQSNWLRMRDYTWTVDRVEKELHGDGSVKSEKAEKWETVILDGEVHHRTLEKDGKPLSAADQRKQQEKMDAALAKLKRESAAQRKKRLAEDEKQRQKDREFLREIPEIYNFDLLGEQTVDGRAVWMVAAKPKPGYLPQRRDARVLQKIEGKLWIDKAEYQWVRLEAETTDTISFGLFLARLAPGAKLLFEQTRINNELWLPKHALVSGVARLAVVKKISIQEDTTWSNYRKFHVDSKIIETR